MFSMVQLVVLDGAKSIMVAVGMKPEMKLLSLPASSVFIYLFPFLPKFSEIKFVSEKYLQKCQQDNEERKCTCPPGFKGDGIKTCEGQRVLV